MFGSLVLVFPTRHEGGALFLRDQEEEWIVDSAIDVNPSTGGGTRVAYVAFYSDVEHEVAVVMSGYRITITYNLYFVDPAPIIQSPQPNSGHLREAFVQLLRDRMFLPKGGFIGFSLRRQYPLPNNPSEDASKLDSYSDLLKDTDAELMNVAKALGLKPKLNLWYSNEQQYYDGEVSDGILCDFIPGDRERLNELSTFGSLRRWGGKRVGRLRSVQHDLQAHAAALSEDLDIDEARVIVEDEDEVPDMGSDYYAEINEGDDGFHFGSEEEVQWYRECMQDTPVDMEVFWVSKPEFEWKDKTGYRTAYVAYGNEVSLEYHYGKLCLIAEVGPYTQRQLHIV